jgi:hypothetical protein
MSHERKLYITSGTNEEHFVSVYRVYFVNTNIWCEYVKCSILYKRDGLRFTTCACYSWEMALNVGLDVPFDNMQNWKEIQEQAREIKNAKAYITTD